MNRVYNLSSLPNPSKTKVQNSYMTEASVGLSSPTSMVWGNDQWSRPRSTLEKGFQRKHLSISASLTQSTQDCKVKWNCKMKWVYEAEMVLIRHQLKHMTCFQLNKQSLDKLVITPTFLGWLTMCMVNFCFILPLLSEQLPRVDT